MHTSESEFSNLGIEYLDNMLNEMKNCLNVLLSGPPVGFVPYAELVTRQCLALQLQQNVKIKLLQRI